MGLPLPYPIREKKSKRDEFDISEEINLNDFEVIHISFGSDSSFFNLGQIYPFLCEQKNDFHIIYFQYLGPHKSYYETFRAAIPPQKNIRILACFDKNQKLLLGKKIEIDYFSNLMVKIKKNAMFYPIPFHTKRDTSGKGRSNGSATQLFAHYSGNELQNLFDPEYFENSETYNLIRKFIYKIDIEAKKLDTKKYNILNKALDNESDKLEQRILSYDNSNEYEYDPTKVKRSDLNRKDLELINTANEIFKEMTIKRKETKISKIKIFNTIFSIFIILLIWPGFVTGWFSIILSLLPLMTVFVSHKIIVQENLKDTKNLIEII